MPRARGSTCSPRFSIEPVVREDQVATGIEQDEAVAERRGAHQQREAESTARRSCRSARRSPRDSRPANDRSRDVISRSISARMTRKVAKLRRCGQTWTVRRFQAGTIGIESEAGSRTPTVTPYDWRYDGALCKKCRGNSNQIARGDRLAITKAALPKRYAASRTGRRRRTRAARGPRPRARRDERDGARNRNGRPGGASRTPAQCRKGRGEEGPEPRRSSRSDRWPARRRCDKRHWGVLLIFVMMVVAPIIGRRLLPLQPSRPTNMPRHPVFPFERRSWLSGRADGRAVASSWAGRAMPKPTCSTSSSRARIWSTATRLRGSTCSAHYTGPYETDPVFALKPGGTVEDLVEYWHRIVKRHLRFRPPGW